jgi:hypothetical protein
VPVYFFMAVIVAIFLGLSVSAEEIVRDRRVLRRERFLHLSWSAYAGAPRCCTSPAGLAADRDLRGIGVAGCCACPGFFRKLWFALFSAAVFGGFLGLNVSARFKSAVTVYILLPLLLLPQMLLGGLIIAYDDLGSRDAPNAYPPCARRTDGLALGLRGAGRRAVPGPTPYQRHFETVDRELSRMDHSRERPDPGARSAGSTRSISIPRRTRDEIRALLVREFRALESESAAPGRRRGGGRRLRRRIAPGGIRSRPACASGRANCRPRARRPGPPQRDPGSLARRARGRGARRLRQGEHQPEDRRIGPPQGAAGSAARTGRTPRPAGGSRLPGPDSAWGRAPFMAGEKRLGKNLSAPTASTWRRCGS